MAKVDWAKQQRLRAIELLVYWEGRVNTTSLKSIFNISREHASRDISFYKKENPRNINYKHEVKGYVISGNFKPKYISEEAAEYLNFVQQSSNNSLSIETIPGPQVAVSPSVLRLVTQAISSKDKLRCQYRSLSHPEGRERVIHPHALVFDGVRWHCRAFDEKRNTYIDLNLSRFTGIPLLDGKSDRSAEADNLWHEVVTMDIVANPSLGAAERDLIEVEYGMKHGVLEVSCRACHVHYKLLSFRINPEYKAKNDTKAASHPLVIGNKKKISEYLFSKKEE